MLYSSDLPQNVCTCIYHKNIMLMLQASHRIDTIYPLYSRDLTNLFAFNQMMIVGLINVTNVKINS